MQSLDDKEKKDFVEKELKKPVYKIIGKEYVDRVYSVLIENKYLTFMSLIFIVIIFYLLTALSSLEEKIKINVEIPPKLYQTGKIYIGYNEANTLFYKVWGEYIARELGNFSPYTIDKKLEQILYLISPDILVKYRAEFLKFSENVKNNLITQTFKPYRVSANNKGNVYVEGLATKIIGDNLLKKDLLCRYNLHFSIKNYHIFLDKINTDCKKISEEEKKVYLKEITKERRKQK